MYFETYNGERYFAFFRAVSKCKDISLAVEPALCSVFSDHQKCYFKKAFQNDYLH